MRHYGMLLVLLAVFFAFPSQAPAADLSLERGLQQDLELSRSIVETAQEKLKEGRPIIDESTRLIALAEGIRASHMLLRERFGLREEKSKQAGVKAYDRHRRMVEAYAGALEEFLALIDSLPSSDEAFPEATLNDLKALLDRILFRKKPHIFGSLPYKNLDYPAKEPIEAPSINPAYMGGNQIVSPDDLKSTLEAPISLEIAAFAESLEWNPVLIYEWVKNNVEAEWYWGCMKGAEETLRQQSGNDCDQAALLIALLRASGFPSRYVRGVIEFFPDMEKVRNLTGIADPEEIARFFQKAGIPFRPVVTGGRIANFQIEHIWVESEIPFANFHGAVVDEYGKAWIGLDTSIKAAGYTHNEPIDIFDEFDLSGIRQGYLNTLRDETPVAYLRAEIEAYLAQSGSGHSYEDLLKTSALLPEVMNLLPASLQFKEIRITHEYHEIPDALIHKARFIAADEANNILLDVTQQTLKLSNREVVISYEPETVEDQEVILSFGGLNNTPAYLVRLRPALKIDGETIAVGTEGLPMGADYDLTIELVSPNGFEKITNPHICGNYTVIGILSGKAVPPDAIPDEEMDARKLLSEEALSYSSRWHRAEAELAALMHLAIARPIPAVVTMGGVMEVTYLLGNPHGFEWKGLYVDADLRAIEAVAGTGLQNGEDRLKVFMQLSSLQGSILENANLEDALQVESISTAKLFQLANESSLPIISIDELNLESTVAALPFAAEIREDITHAVNQGLTVKIPESDIAYLDWTGTGYIKEDPDSGASGWMLSGTIAGGMTASGMAKWLNKFKALIKNPYSEPPNYDPASAYSIYKVPGGDMQKGTVGEPLPLSVKVFDFSGKPVMGAKVTFTVTAGGGTFLEDAQTTTAITGFDGIASVKFTLGEKTRDNPIYWWEAGYTNHQQVGLNLVQASLASGTRLRQGFWAYGFPTAPMWMKKIYGDGATKNILGFSGFVTASVEDEYDNRISNLPVEFEALAVSGGCGQDNRSTLLVEESDPCLKDHPVYGECKTVSQKMKVTTSHRGASVHYISGGRPGATYTIGATYGNLSQTFSYNTVPSSDCMKPTPKLMVRCIIPADAYGFNINAAQVGSSIPVKARLLVLKGKDGKYTLNTDYKEAVVTFDDNPGIEEQKGISGVYTSTSRKLVAGGNCIAVKAKARVNWSHGGASYSKVFSANNRIIAYGVKVENLGIEDTLTSAPLTYIPLDQFGYSLKDFNIVYSITPSEYFANWCDVVILKKENNKSAPIYYLAAERSGDNELTVAKGELFDKYGTYEAEVVLNRGNTFQGKSLEIKSGRIPLPVAGAKVLADDVKLTTTVDRVNSKICTSTEYLNFYLFQNAKVTIEVDGSVISKTVGTQKVPIKDMAFTEGLHEKEILITRDMVPLPGKHEFKITAKFDAGSTTAVDIATGDIIHEVAINEAYPIGHTFIKGVDIHDGHLTHSSRDVSIPGRGLSLSFTRSYSSAGSTSGGPFGAGWTHKYHMRIIRDGCGRFVVVGGEGTGSTFTKPYKNAAKAALFGLPPTVDFYKPQIGYHSNLVRDPQAPKKFDFYNKAHIKYHFELEKALKTDETYTLRYIEEPNGNRITLKYDVAKPKGDGDPSTLDTVTDSSGRALVFTYETYTGVDGKSKKRIERITGHNSVTGGNLLGLNLTYKYDSHNNLIKATRDVRIETYEYTKHNLKKIIDPEGNVTEYIYYSQQDTLPGHPGPGYKWWGSQPHIFIFPEIHEFVKSVTEGSGTSDTTTTQFLYNYVNNTRTVTNGRGYQTQYTLNDYGSVIEIVDPKDYKTTIKWAMDLGINDVYIVERTDAVNNTTKYEYDDNGNVTKVTDPLNYITTTDYDTTYNKPTKITDANNHTTKYDYDSKGNLETEEDPLKKITTHTYYSNGLRKSTIDANSKTTKFTYDQYGNIATIKDPEGGITSNTYDPRSRLILTIDANNNETSYEYDELDRIEEKVDALAYLTQYTYDNNGNKTSVTNAKGHKTEYKYDALNRLEKEIDAYQNAITYEYDENNNKVKEIDRRGKATAYKYNELDRLFEQIDANQKKMTISYDKVGNKTSEVDYNGHSTTYTYDDLYRLTDVVDALNNVTTYGYDAVGNKTSEIDPRNHETVFVYDAANRLTETIDAQSKKSIIQYDGVGNKKKEIDRNGHSTSYDYDGNNRLTSVTDQLNYSISYTYDDVGNKLTEIDQNTHTTTFEYDVLNRLEKKIDPIGYVTKTEYDAVGNVTKIIDAKLNTTIQEYDKLDRLLKVHVIEPVTGKKLYIVYSYDANGNKETETNRRNFTYFYQYDNVNRLEKVTDPLGNYVTYEYDGVGNKTKEIDKKGIVTVFGYDDVNRLKKEIRAGTTIRSYDYDKAGNKSEETDAEGNTTYYDYDKLNRLYKITKPLNTITSYTYDDEGNKLTETNPQGHTTTFTYDELNRLKTVLNPELNLTRYDYDGVGNKTKVIEPKGANYATENMYDKNNRLTKVIDAYGKITEYTYDGNGNRDSQIDANLNLVTYKYDSLSRRTRMIQHAASGNLVTQFGYDENGNRTQLIDPKGQVFTFTYDELDRLEQKTYPPPKDIIYPYLKSISYTYDDNNNEERVDEVKVISAGTIKETTQKTYDNFDRLTSVTDRDNKIISFTYYDVGNRKTVTDPDSKVTTYDYNALNRLSAAHTVDGTTQYFYYPDGQADEIIYPNGTRAKYVYDKANLLTSIHNYSSAGTISLYSYTYDNNGNRETMEETQEGITELTSYNYDFCNRLLEVVYPVDNQYPAGRQVTYTYDDVGNRLTEVEKDNNAQTLASKTYAYNGLNRLETITDNLGSDHVSYGYDDNGNVISKTKAGVTTNYRYDVKDRLRLVSEGTTDLAGFDYNYQGMRITKTGNDGEVRYVYDDRAVLMETDAAGNTIAKYNYADQLLSLTHHKQGSQFYLFSGLGSVSNLTNANGTLRCSYKYDAWGNFRKKSDASWNKKTFTGKEWDEETGLFYFGARFYDPETGRFITLDPYLGDINTPPSLHRYLYCYANPMRYVDLYGYEPRSAQSVSVVGVLDDRVITYSPMWGLQATDVHTAFKLKWTLTQWRQILEVGAMSRVEQLEYYITRYEKILEGGGYKGRLKFPVEVDKTIFEEDPIVQGELSYENYKKLLDAIQLKAKPEKKGLIRPEGAIEPEGKLLPFYRAMQELVLTFTPCPAAKGIGLLGEGIRWAGKRTLVPAGGRILQKLTRMRANRPVKYVVTDKGLVPLSEFGGVGYDLPVITKTPTGGRWVSAGRSGGHYWETTKVPKKKLKAKVLREMERGRTAAKKKIKTPGGHDAQKVIDDITRSEQEAKHALDQFRRDPSEANLDALEKAQTQFDEIKAAFEELARRDRGFK